MLMYQKNMFDHYHCIKPFCHLKTLKNASKSSFLYYYNGAQKHEGFIVFEKPFSRAKPSVSISLIPMHITVDDVSFCGGLVWVFYEKYKSHASTAHELPD